MALTLTLTGVPGGHSQPEAAQQEAAMGAEHPGLDDLLRQAERLLLLREDLQRLREDQGERESGEGRAVRGCRARGGRGERWGKAGRRGRGSDLVIRPLAFQKLRKSHWPHPHKGRELTISWDQIALPSHSWGYFTES